MKKFLKGKRGVTLVALVVTIIVLLILAAITINLTIGENGIITTAKQAGKNYQEATNTEQNILADFWSGADETIGSAVSAQNSRGVGNAKSSEILEGRTAYVNGEIITGTMANFSNTRINIAKESEVSKEDEYTYVNIPEAGYYDTTTQIGIANESLESKYGATIIKLGSGTSYNIKEKYPDIYESLTADNFIVSVSSASSTAYAKCNESEVKYGCDTWISWSCSISKLYNSSTRCVQLEKFVK